AAGPVRPARSARRDPAPPGRRRRDALLRRHEGRGHRRASRRDHAHGAVGLGRGPGLALRDDGGPMIGRPVRSPAQADAPSPVDPAVPARSERAAGVLAEILDLPEPERGAKLAQLADETLRGEVVRLLAFAEAADRAGFLADDPPDL